MQRDFTYVDDIVEGVIRVTDRVATPMSAYDPLQPDPATSSAPYRVFNIGNHHPVPLMDFIACIEQALGREGHQELPAAAGWRRAGHLRRRAGPEGLGRLQALPPPLPRASALRRLVPRVLPA
jgi:UDP-glucuronate 4-epimerase